MKWTLAFLLAAIAVVYFGVLHISDRQANAGEPANLPIPALQANPVPIAPPATTAPAGGSVEYVSGCIETANSCRCIDKQGKPLELTREDCQGVLRVGPR